MNLIAPCNSLCMQDSKCRNIQNCNAWEMFKTAERLEREGKKMKCPKCHNNMERKEANPGVYYFECPKCHYDVGKLKEVSHEVQEE